MYLKVVSKNFKVLLHFQEESRQVMYVITGCVDSTVFWQGHTLPQWHTMKKKSCVITVDRG